MKILLSAFLRELSRLAQWLDQFAFTPYAIDPMSGMVMICNYITLESGSWASKEGSSGQQIERTPDFIKHAETEQVIEKLLVTSHTENNVVSVEIQKITDYLTQYAKQADALRILVNEFQEAEARLPEKESPLVETSDIEKIQLLDSISSQLYSSPYANAKNLSKWVRNFVEHYLLPRYPSGVGVLGIAGMGASGTAILTAINQYLYLYHGIEDRFIFLLCSKRKEITHRGIVSQSSHLSSNTPIIIVDDDISTGRTMEQIKMDLDQLYTPRSLHVTAIACTDAIEYQDMLKQLYPNLKTIIY